MGSLAFAHCISGPSAWNGFLLDDFSFPLIFRSDIAFSRNPSQTSPLILPCDNKELVVPPVFP